MPKNSSTKAKAKARPITLGPDSSEKTLKAALKLLTPTQLELTNVSLTIVNAIKGNYFTAEQIATDFAIAMDLKKNEIPTEIEKTDMFYLLEQHYVFEKYEFDLAIGGSQFGLSVDGRFAAVVENSNQGQEFFLPMPLVSLLNCKLTDVGKVATQGLGPAYGFDGKDIIWSYLFGQPFGSICVPFAVFGKLRADGTEPNAPAFYIGTPEGLLPLDQHQWDRLDQLVFSSALSRWRDPKHINKTNKLLIETFKPPAGSDQLVGIGAILHNEVMNGPALNEVIDGENLARGLMAYSEIRYEEGINDAEMDFAVELNALKKQLKDVERELFTQKRIAQANSQRAAQQVVQVPQPAPEIDLAVRMDALFKTYH